MCKIVKKNCLWFKTNICLVIDSWDVFVVTNKKKYESHLGNIICMKFIFHFSKVRKLGIVRNILYIVRMNLHWRMKTEFYVRA